MSALVIRFNDPDQWRDEVLEFVARRGPDAVEDRTARISTTYRPAGPNGVLTRIGVAAGVILAGTGRPLLLERELGDLWDGPGDDRLRELAEVTLRDLRRRLEASGLRVAGGLVEIREPRPER